MEKSILKTIKKLLGITEDDTAFDTDLIIHINTTLMVLHQLGVGPKEGYSIKNEKNKWSDFVDSDENLEGIKSYIYMKVKLLFDPPSNSATIEALQSSIKEFEWRLNVGVETNFEEV